MRIMSLPMNFGWWPGTDWRVEIHFIQQCQARSYKDHQWRAINESDLSLSTSSCTQSGGLPSPTNVWNPPHVAFVHHGPCWRFFWESWRSVGNVPLYSHLCGETHGAAMLLLSTLMTWGSLSTAQRSLISKQSFSGEHARLHFLCLWCPLLSVSGYGCAIKEKHIFQVPVLRAGPPALLVLVFCLGRVLMGIAISPKRRQTQGGPPLRTGYETLVRFI